MDRKVKVFRKVDIKRLEEMVNAFGESHKIIQVSFSAEEKCYSCMVLYEDYKDIFVNI